MRREARNAYACRMLFDDFPRREHRDTLLRALKNALNTDLTIFTFAQLIDGLPTADVCFDKRFTGIFGDHIIDDMHEELCDGAMERAREMAADWGPPILKFIPLARSMYLPSASDQRVR